MSVWLHFVINGTSIMVKKNGEKKPKCISISSDFRCLKGLETFNEESRNQFSATLDWLNQWACCRTFGLGTNLPWDRSVLIESLSDSTFYMAYYTIAHYLQPPNSLDGSIPKDLGEKGPWLGIKPNQLDDQFFEFIFRNLSISTLLGTDGTYNGISKQHLEKMKSEFDYYYPFNLRVSGKDLIPNHLTFCLYNHVALYPQPQKDQKHPNWPLGIRSNGHLLLNGLKMSKSTGNFMTLNQSLELYGADATRLSLADAGDGTEDANFETATANAAILKLYTLLEWIDQQTQVPMRSSTDGKGQDEFVRNLDLYFLTELMHLCKQSYDAYTQMMYRNALKLGFYDVLALRDFYRDACISLEILLNKECFHAFLKALTIILTPITPHWSSEVWSKFVTDKKESELMNVVWDVELKELQDKYDNDHEFVSLKFGYLKRLIKNVKTQISSLEKKAKKSLQFTNMVVFIASIYPEWKLKAIESLKSTFSLKPFGFDESKLKEVLVKDGWMKDKKSMPFMMEIKKRILGDQTKSAFSSSMEFNEVDWVHRSIPYLKSLLGVSDVVVIDLCALKEGEVNEVQQLNPDKVVLNQAAPGEPQSRLW